VGASDAYSCELTTATAMPSTLSIQVPSDDPKKKTDKSDDKGKNVASKPKDGLNSEAEELVRIHSS